MGKCCHLTLDRKHFTCDPGGGGTPVKERAAKVGVRLPPTPEGASKAQLRKHQKACRQKVATAEERADDDPLKRKRRSRKIRTTTVKEEKFVPLIPGAKQTTDESILKAYLVPDELDGQQKAGEDYYVDPRQIAAEMEEKRKVEARVKKFKKKKEQLKSLQNLLKK